MHTHKWQVLNTCSFEDITIFNILADFHTHNRHLHKKTKQIKYLFYADPVLLRIRFERRRKMQCEYLQVSPTWLHELRMEIVYLLHNMTRILTISWEKNIDKIVNICGCVKNAIERNTNSLRGFLTAVFRKKNNRK